ncbi:hypothetical protein [Dinghuibacter silviterrae]|uniref:PAP2 superfamily protein n=1 Tax=Dinghuibacter silviterrae TaxID=1539049 RepID=A0A4R8DPI3_9BACT|nr:hypothetical protein [Dinghuibacter silviterrae]TDW99768.1 hypothetical protein EDB95_0779 [Dinghuibacter silviterrae]
MKKIIATVVSYLFHPIWLVPLMAAYLIFADPVLYLGVSPHIKLFRLLTVVLNSVFFPLISVLLARAVGFIKSIQMKDASDRIIPYVATLTWYFWDWMAMRNLGDTPAPMTAMLFGVFLSASAALIFNTFLKISMHTIGVGGLVAFFLLISLQGAQGTALPLAISILIAGLVWSARLIVSNHTQRELVLGFLVGFLCQVAGTFFFH